MAITCDLKSEMKLLRTWCDSKNIDKRKLLDKVMRQELFGATATLELYHKIKEYKQHNANPKFSILVNEATLSEEARSLIRKSESAVYNADDIPAVIYSLKNNFNIRVAADANNEMAKLLSQQAPDMTRLREMLRKVSDVVDKAHAVVGTVEDTELPDIDHVNGSSYEMDTLPSVFGPSKALHLIRGQLMNVQAKVGTGKSLLAKQAVLSVAEEGHPVMLWSKEETVQEACDKISLHCIGRKIKVDKLQGNKKERLSKAEWQIMRALYPRHTPVTRLGDSVPAKGSAEYAKYGSLMARAYAKCRAYPYFVADSSKFTTLQGILDVAEERKVHLLVLDQLKHLVALSDVVGKYQTETNAYNYVVLKLADWAKRTNTAVLTLHQLNKEDGGFGSSQIQQGVFVEIQWVNGIAEVTKNRNGTVGKYSIDVDTENCCIWLGDRIDG